ncbi:MAG: iron-containing alcohol dehydrogenase [Candidatus Viridilinea halotolerans]|uniref:Iron-containing alcohol dehydrogenase n=1 Tax=Candidatus Viridilinea halotolerans TaxID=2491704 RepID=A0A426UAE2_9CHLR|nr:MAG: iron-containing alcohol dehydrogenase [Candidatus Viridilinea halotolerans]
MQPREFITPAHMVVGSNAVEQVGEQCRKRGWSKALIVTDKIMASLGLVARVEQLLAASEIGSVVYAGVNSEPVVEFVQEGLDIYKANACDFVVAVGGGSPIDAAKAVAVLVTNPGSIEQYKGLGKLANPGVPLVAIPTTAGTGSEATLFTIITDQKTDVKMLIGSPYLMPTVAIVDPLLTLSSPPGVTAATGIDALVHAIEAYVSVKRQPMSDMFCLSAIELISQNIRQAWANGNNIAAREQMMLGAMQAGIAFSNASVALVHGMSRPIGANFHIAHGVSNAALLAVVTDFSLIGDPVRYARIAQVMGENTSGLALMDAADRVVVAIRRLVRDIRIPSLRQLGVERERLMELAPAMADAAIDSGSPGNNPRKPTKQEIIELYARAFDEE